MRLDLTLRFDEDGDPRAEVGDPTFHLLGHFLESELQGSVALCDEWLAALSTLDAPDADVLAGTGNVLGWQVDHQLARLDTEVGASTATLALPRDLLHDAIVRWRALLADGA